MSKAVMPYCPDDRHACIDLYVDVFTHAPWQYDWITAAKVARYFADLERTPCFRGFVLREIGQKSLLGFCFGLLTDYFNSTNYEIKEIAVARTRQRQGVGSRLLQETEAWLRQRGVSTLTLTTRRDIDAYAFYTKNDYTVSESAAIFYKAL